MPLTFWERLKRDTDERNRNVTNRRHSERIRLALHQAKEDEEYLSREDVIRWRAMVVKLLSIRKRMDETDEELVYAHGHHSTSWVDSFPGIRVVSEKLPHDDHDRLCDCPYWQHEIGW